MAIREQPGPNDEALILFPSPQLYAAPTQLLLLSFRYGEDCRKANWKLEIEVDKIGSSQYCDAVRLSIDSANRFIGEQSARGRIRADFLRDTAALRKTIFCRRLISWGG
jgi:hypothetical protein